MEHYDFGDILYCRADEFDTYVPSDEWVRALVRDFTKRRTFKRLLEAYEKSLGMQGHAILQAHGGYRNGSWIFMDGRKESGVQEWIDEFDGSYPALILFVCNRTDKTIASEKSLVMHTRGAVNRLDLINYAPLRIYVPEEGYVEKNYYRIRKVLKKLERI